MARLGVSGNSNRQALGIGQRHCDVHARLLGGWRCSLLGLAPWSWRPIARMRLPIRVDVYDDHWYEYVHVYMRDRNAQNKLTMLVK